MLKHIRRIKSKIPAVKFHVAKKAAWWIMGILSAAALLLSGFFLGFRAGEMYPKTINITDLTNTSSGQPAAVNFGTFWQAWDVINKEYLNADKMNAQDKVYGAISGLINSLKDPYSVFLSPKDNAKFQEDIQGNFGGIGAEIGIRNNRIVIVAPLKDTPASRAGLRAGDTILKINSTSTEGMSIYEAVGLIRGPEESKVLLNIFREGWIAPQNFEITRDTIQVPTLDFTIKDGEIAYIQLYSFNANASYLFGDAAMKTLSGGAKGIILDLRDNPGGYLEVATDIAGWFLERNNLIVKEESKDGNSEEFKAVGNGLLAKIPVVVIINGGSASASEILAGALHDNRGIKLIGEKSFGKGTVQKLISLPDGSTVKLTIAHWVLPSGKILESGGLDPDIKVKMDEDDSLAKRDPQLDKALEIIKQEIGR
ncbi:MAG: S41 family peptidase [Candidatus Liptonbacteria bacterium]|nr:S41 family peptidase [Candidatus Liptonbacteria bacterium]